MSTFEQRRQSRIITITLIVVSAVIISGAIWHLRDGRSFAELFNGAQEDAGVNANGTRTTPSPDDPPSPADSSPEPIITDSFYDLAMKYGTDKVTTHNYHHMYHKHIAPLRYKPIKMLEIGLGCDMNYGPGASYYTWLDFIPNVDLYYIEYDAACAEKWAHKTTGATIFSGDQADIPFLEDFLKKTGGGFDIIIDDGGHTMHQQITSLETLFASVKPGGIYFIEDLQTSYMHQYGGGPDSDQTTLNYIKEMHDDLNVASPSGPANFVHEVSRNVQSIECMEEICAFFKKEL